MEKKIKDKEIIRYIKEKEAIARLFTHESILVTIYNKAIRCNVNGDFIKWLEQCVDTIEQKKIEYTSLTLKDPLQSPMDCLEDLKLIS